MREEKSWAGEVDFGPSSVFGSAQYNAVRPSPEAALLRWLQDEDER